VKLLQLHFSQISKIWSKSRNNNYSDKSRSDYHAKLKQLYSLLLQEDFSKVERLEVEEKKQILSFFSESVTFLDNSTVTSLPFELVKCLEIALNEWSPDEYIIVTCKVKGINAFSFDPKLAINDSVYDILKQNYNISFEKRLIQINVPEYLIGDYLANVILYHELGHFIESKYNIPDVICFEFLGDISNGKVKGDFYKYFPFMKGISDIYGEEVLDQIKSHIAEYFCDLFASQYVDRSVNHYLSYIANDGLSRTHPSTENRLSLVSKFLNKEKSYTLDKIKYAVNKMTFKKLKIRYKIFSSNDFIRLLPITIKSEKELHYLFIYGWNLWLSDWKQFEIENKMKFQLKELNVYEIINDLIEKSIGNYIVMTTWEKVKNVSIKKGN